VPKKGLPRCKNCNRDRWRLIRLTESSAVIECCYCMNRARTKSRRVNSRCVNESSPPKEPTV
jgi:hypothetical protein